MLIVMAGLPGTGKSTLAARLTDVVGGTVLSKDVVRAALFPPSVLDYSSAQDEIAMSAVYEAARYILEAHPEMKVVLDGRTFLKPEQLAAPLQLASSLAQTVRVIECVCADAVAGARLASDHETGTHLARNRTPALYNRVKAAAVPLTVPRLTLDTGALTQEECVDRARAYISE